MAVTIVDRIARVVDQIETGPDLDTKFQRLVEKEIRRRLAEYEATCHRLERKYGMTLEQFESTRMIEKLGYSFEVESDYHDWDQAVDAISTLQEQLRELIGTAK